MICHRVTQKLEFFKNTLFTLVSLLSAKNNKRKQNLYYLNVEILRYKPQKNPKFISLHLWNQLHICLHTAVSLLKLIKGLGIILPF